MSMYDSGGRQPQGLSEFDDRQAARLEVRFEVQRLRGFSDLLSRSVEVFRDNLKIILLVTLVLAVPFNIAVSFCDTFTQGSDVYSALSSLASLTQSICLAFATPAIIYAMLIRMRDARDASFSEAMTCGGKAGWRTFGYRLLVGLIMVVGLLLLIVPGILFAVWYSLTDVVVAVEGRNHPGVLARSKQLTEGKRWWIFGFFMLYGGVFLVIGIAVGFLSVLIDSSMTEIWSIQGFLSFVLNLIFSIILSVLMWVATAMALVIYMDAVGTHDMECSKCGYNLTGNVSGACTECGEYIPEDIQQMLVDPEPVPQEPWSG